METISLYVGDAYGEAMAEDFIRDHNVVEVKWYGPKIDRRWLTVHYNK